MATAAPFVKLLRQLSNAKDEYRSGALDITWDGGQSSIYLVFGQPNHATFEAETSEPLAGPEALTALLNNLPRTFKVAPWRKAMTRDGTLKLSLDELMEPFAQLAGAASPDDESENSINVAGIEVGTGYEADFTFGLEDFPLLPAGQSMFSDAAINVVHLDLLLPKLPPSLIVLTGPKLRAAAVVLNGQLIDAVWVDDQEKAAGEGAAMAIMGARDGTVSGYRLDNSRIAEALTMLWRCPPRYKDLSVEWLDPDRFLSSLTQERRDCAVLIDGPDPGVGLFMGGEFIAGYSRGNRHPDTSLDGLRVLLGSAGSLSILQRASDRPVGRSLDESDYHAVIAVAEEPVAEAASFEDVAVELAPESAAEFGNVEGSQAPIAATPEVVPAWMVPSEPAPAEEPVAEEPAAFDEYPATTQEPSVEPTVEPAAAESYRTTDEMADPHDGFTHYPAAVQVPAYEPETPPWSVVDRAPAEEPAPNAPTNEPEAPQWSVVSGLDSEAAPSEPDIHEPSAPAAQVPVSAESAGLDFESIRNDLIQIGVLWLGGDDVAGVAELIHNTGSTVEDFVTTIESIKEMTVAGHDPSVIRAMAREMHYHAAEYLSGV